MQDTMYSLEKKILIDDSSINEWVTNYFNFLGDGMVEMVGNLIS